MFNCLCVSVHICAWATQWVSKCVCVCVKVRDRLRDMPPPVLRAAGFWQKQRFRGQKEGDRERESQKRRRRGFGRGTDARPCGDGRVTSSVIGFSFLTEVDLEISVPLTDSDCSVNTRQTRSPALSPRPPSAGDSRTCMRVCTSQLTLHSCWHCTKY